MILKEVIEKLNLIDDEKLEIEKIEKLHAEEIEKIAEDYFLKRESFPHYLKKIRKTLKEISPYTADLLLVLHLTSFLKDEYEKKGIPESMFWGFVRDIRCKKDECRNVKNVLGTFVAEWYEGFFMLYRFSFGRLQGDLIKSEEDIEAPMGKVKKGDFVVSCHIPSDGKLNYEDCIKAYRTAYEFLSERFEGALPIICISWLLYPPYRNVFKVCPNIEGFIRDFTIYREEKEESFLDAWRVFNTQEYENTKLLKRDTRLRRAYIDYIESGGTFGEGYGILFFDGENIIV